MVHASPFRLGALSNLHNQRLAIMTVEGSPNQQDKKDDQAKELDAIFLVLDCIIDLGLGDRGLSQPK